jgi:ankyrin repeat protein
MFRSPLQCAFTFRQTPIARLLLSKGAEVHHINAKGWTPTFSLFGYTVSPEYSTTCKEYLEILSAASFTEFDAQDGEGWSCMHRAAAFGHADDVIALMKLRAPLALRTIKVSWPPIFCAVQFGNISTFNELRKHHPDLLVMRDVRKWTLLHVAVNAKRLEIIQLLISLGADPHAQSLATEFIVPEDIRGLSVTPGDIARLRGSLVLFTYISALKANGHDLEVVADEMNNVGEIFWPASDNVSLSRQQ